MSGRFRLNGDAEDQLWLERELSAYLILSGLTREQVTFCAMRDYLHAQTIDCDRFAKAVKYAKQSLKNEINALEPQD